jgi:mono/diheme cytochrome c family protein
VRQKLSAQGSHGVRCYVALLPAPGDAQIVRERGRLRVAELVGEAGHRLHALAMGEILGPDTIKHRNDQLSTRNLTAADLDAVATYLLGDSPPAPTSLAAPDPADVAADANGAGRIGYVALCAGCHGLEGRGIVGEMELSRSFTGFALGRVAAPDITPTGLAARGWTAAALVAFLGRGLARQGSAFSDMHPVIMATACPTRWSRCATTAPCAPPTRATCGVWHSPQWPSTFAR